MARALLHSGEADLSSTSPAEPCSGIEPVPSVWEQSSVSLLSVTSKNCSPGGQYFAPCGTCSGFTEVSC